MLNPPTGEDLTAIIVHTHTLQMPVAVTIPSYQHRIYALLFSITKAKKTTMASTNSSNSGGAFTTIQERVTFEKEIKKSKFIAIAGPIPDEKSAMSFLSQVGDQYRSNDDGEPSGTAGKPIQTAIDSSGIDRVMVVVIRYFGGIKLGTGGLARAYGGVASECLRNAPTCFVKTKIIWGIKLGTGGLARAYGGVASECLRNAPTCFLKTKFPKSHSRIHNSSLTPMIFFFKKHRLNSWSVDLVRA
ncbi:hypothetical protein JHK85_023280 [Glycine max]|nr:hypothetical protein JHK85_023280 [Glycine max]